MSRRHVIYATEACRHGRRARGSPAVPARRYPLARYQRLFREFIATLMNDDSELAQLWAELTAAAAVAAHNHVLRHWLRGKVRTRPANWTGQCAR